MQFAHIVYMTWYFIFHIQVSAAVNTISLCSIPSDSIPALTLYASSIYYLAAKGNPNATPWADATRQPNPSWYNNLSSHA